MKRKIAILGSTGSIGKTLLDIIEKEKKNFDVHLLTANNDYKTLLKQAKKFKVKNLVITNRENYELLKKKTKKLNIKIFNNFEQLDKIFNLKLDYVMSSITGIEGLNPTINIIKFTNKIAIANKESIICGWNLIKKEMLKHKTNFIPVDSEHFSIWSLLKNNEKSKIEKIYITASGGPFLRLPKKKFNKISIKNALKHPNWKMGKKITIDSATLMNKVFEVIEAYRLFNLKPNQVKITIHPQSIVHAIINYKNGTSHALMHNTSMKIPIYSAIYGILLFDEMLLNFHYFGAAFVFMGVYLARKINL